MNHFNICPNCMHRNTCVLTAQKDKVWSCSEFEEETPSTYHLGTVHVPKLQQKRALI